MSEIEHHVPRPLAPQAPAEPQTLASAVPPGTTIAWTAQGQPIYVPQQQPQVLLVQQPSTGLPDWVRNLLIVAVGLLILCTPLTVLLVVAAPAIAATGQAVAYGGLGIAVAVIGVAAAIKSLRETPRPPEPETKPKRRWL